MTTLGRVTVGGAPLTSPAFAGTPTAPTPTTGDDTTKIATTAFVRAVGNEAVPPTGHIHDTAGEAITTTQATIECGGATDFTAGGMTVSGNGLEVPAAGFYVVCGVLATSVATGDIVAFLVQNSNVVAQAVLPAALAGNGFGLTAIVKCAVGDVLTLQGKLSTGSGTVAPTTTWLAASYYGPAT